MGFLREISPFTLLIYVWGVVFYIMGWGIQFRSVLLVVGSMRVLEKGNVNADTATCLNRTLMTCHGIKSTTSKSSLSITVTRSFQAI